MTVEEHVAKLATTVETLSAKVAELERVNYEQTLVNYDVLLAIYDLMRVAYALHNPNQGEFSKEIVRLRMRLDDAAPRLQTAQIGGISEQE